LGVHLDGKTTNRKGSAGRVRATRACRGREIMVESPGLTIEELDSQLAVELPDREMLTLVVIKNVSILNNNRLFINVRNNNVAAQVCALVAVLDLLTANRVTCTIRQT
jgi:hypothetical protein